MDMRAYQIEEKLERLERAVEALRREVEGIKSDIRKRHEADGQAEGSARAPRADAGLAHRAREEAAGETGTPKKRTRKKAEPAE